MKNHILVMLVLLSLSSYAALNEADIVSENNLRVYLLNQDPDPAEPGKYVEVRFRLQNFGYGGLEGVKAELLYDAPFSFDDPTDALVDVGSLSGRQIDDYGALVKWKLRVDKDAIEGEHTVRLRISFNDKVIYTTDEYTLTVRTQDAILSVGEVTTQPSKVAPGQEARLRITLENHADSLLKDVVLTLATQGTSFAPLSSSSEQTIKQLTAQQSAHVEYVLLVDALAPEKVHQLSLSIKYSDNVGTAYAKNVTISVPVYSEPRFVLNMEESTLTQDKSKGDVVISFSNVGTSELKYVRIELLDTDAIQVLSAPLSYLGNLEADDFQTAEFTLYADSGSDTLTLPVQVTFADAYNIERTLTKEVSVPLFDEHKALLYGITQPKNYAPMLFGIGIGFLVLVFWLSMLVHAVTTTQPLGRKVVWVAIIVVANVLGAVVYYLLGRKKAV
jgi:hypothetical protein